MFEQTVTIQNPSGLHARPGSALTALCKKFPQEISLLFEDRSVNPKSIVALLSAGIKCGSVIVVRVDGDDADVAGKEIVEFLQQLED